MSKPELINMFLGLTVLLIAARAGGMLVARWKLPAVVGELAAGIILGPSVFGALMPGLQAALLPAKGNGAIFLAGFKALACVLFMLTAGLEVNLAVARQQGRKALGISVAGILVPFALGFGVASAVPQLLGYENHTTPTLFALFFATAMSITALPVIVKTITDLGLQRTRIGTLVVAAAMCDDLMGWLIFGVVLQLAGGAAAHHSLGTIVTLVLMFTVLALGPLRAWLVGRSLSGSSVVMLGLLGAAYTEWAGIHAIFGAFLIGVALATAVREEARHAMEIFVGSFFAPIFFATVGLSINFLANFDLVVVLVVLAVACAGKFSGCFTAARALGMNKRDSVAVGIGMNGRGAMEIVLGSVAYQQGIIGARLFVALITMAAVTSALTGVTLARLYPHGTDE